VPRRARSSFQSSPSVGSSARSVCAAIACWSIPALARTRSTSWTASGSRLAQSEQRSLVPKNGTRPKELRETFIGRGSHKLVPKTPNSKNYHRVMVMKAESSRRSTGPRTYAGKRRSSRNALRHGLSLPVRCTPELDKQVAELAHILANGSTDPIRIERAEPFCASTEHNVNQNESASAHKAGHSHQPRTA
jgi:hypothetical protein